MALSLLDRPMLNPQALPPVEVGGLYVHIPFCFHKCHYCDFYSITRQTDERMTAFVDRVLREAELWHQSRAAPNLRPRTVFFGGGTPSLLPIDAMRRLLLGLAERIDLSQVDEWTVEVNPATADGAYLAMMRSCRVTRISMGAQSFDPKDLRVLERHHNPEDVPRGVELARAAGFSRINVDLIFAVPGQTLQSWADSLDRAIKLGTPHISCYALTYEPNTPLAVRKRLGQVVAAAEELELEMLRHTRRRLAQAGYAAYEISNFATPLEPCRHNLNYWNCGDYIGLGPSAASHVAGWRWKNRPHLGEWERAVDDSSLPGIEIESLDPHRRMGEYAMLRLRLAEGLCFAAFADRFGVGGRAYFRDPIVRYTSAGLLDTDDTRVALSDAGIAVADAIAAEFLSIASEKSRASSPL